MQGSHRLGSWQACVQRFLLAGAFCAQIEACFDDAALSIEDIEVAPPKKDEVRIKILYSGLCHTVRLTFAIEASRKSCLTYLPRPLARMPIRFLAKIPKALSLSSSVTREVV